MIGDTTLTTHRMRYSAAYPTGAERIENSRVEHVERVEILHWINRIDRIGHRDNSRKERKGRKELNHEIHEKVLARLSRSLGVVRSNREPPTSGGYV